MIGLELGSVWGRLGAEVTVVEFLDRILPGTDAEVAKQFQRMLEKQGFRFHLGHKVTKVEKTEADLAVSIEPSGGGETTVLSADVVLVAIGRRPVTDGLGLEALGVALDRGQVVIDARFATNVPGIYAIGDVVRGPMLAHKAEDEGIAVAEIIAGPTWPCELRGHSLGRLHHAGDRLRRRDRGGISKPRTLPIGLANSPSPPMAARGRCGTRKAL